MIRSNRLRQKLDSGELALGAYAGAFGDPMIVELIALAGFDVVFIDTEHNPLDLSQIVGLIRAADATGISALIRFPTVDPSLLRLLDAGAHAVCVSHVSTAEEARAIVRAVRFPPLGERGLNSQTRAALYGEIPVRSHLERANTEVVLGLWVEDAAVLGEIDEIAATPGVDLIAVGPNDLSRSLGLAGRPDDPRLREAIETLATRIRRAGRHLAFPLEHSAYPLDVKGLRALGVSYANCAPSPEVRLLGSWKEQARRAREAIGPG